jgi:predicted enzyme related to lactoylglutathione lyase
MMARAFQVTIDSSDPRALGGFWAEVLGYVEDAPPPGFATWPEALTAWGLPAERHNDAYAVVDPDGARPRVFLQKVPEGKTAKNRMHLDFRASDRTAEVARLVGLGATEHASHDEWGVSWTVLTDPEGNEFCVSQERAG